MAFYKKKEEKIEEKSKKKEEETTGVKGALRDLIYLEQCMVWCVKP